MGAQQKRQERRGGKRKGAGRKPLGNVRMLLTVNKTTAAKIEKLRKAEPLWKRAGQVVEEIMRPISVHGAEYLDASLLSG